ncbi:hypothetical protein, partial [Pseudomonas syringae group genomosp. 7]|uniref:hypothetical protein n=1 Tax=Pseudomonas syringae group genomosp. 7 TaxID=251699 RepID=UPI003770129A
GCLVGVWCVLFGCGGVWVCFCWCWGWGGGCLGCLGWGLGVLCFGGWSGLWGWGWWVCGLWVFGLWWWVWFLDCFCCYWVSRSRMSCRELGI